KRLSQAVRAGLDGVTEIQTKAATVTEQTLKRGLIFSGGDDQYVLNTRQHKHGKRIVDHRLVVNRQQLLGYTHCRWVKAGAAAAGQNYAFHALTPSRSRR